MPQVQQLLAPNSISYGRNDPQWIVVHYTATNASACNNAAYFSRGGNGGSSAHYFVDGGGVIYQSVPGGRGAWHAGNYECNTHSIGIEVVSAGQDFTAAEISELAWLVQRLMREHGIPASHVIRHYDVADVFGGYTLDPHKSCPAPYVDAQKWAALKSTITSGAAGEGEDMYPAELTKEGQEVFRMYDAGTGEHLLTANAAERDALAKSGWRCEGAAFRLPEPQVAVYRMYKPGGKHLLTAAYKEASALAKSGWRCEGVAFWAAKSGAPVRRLYDAKTGDHLLTVNQAEADACRKAGWADEGVAFFV